MDALKAGIKDHQPQILSSVRTPILLMEHHLQLWLILSLVVAGSPELQTNAKDGFNLREQISAQST